MATAAIAATADDADDDDDDNMSTCDIYRLCEKVCLNNFMLYGEHECIHTNVKKTRANVKKCIVYGFFPASMLSVGN